LTITKKLVLGYGTLVAILVLLSGSLYFVIESMNSNYEHATDKAGKRLVLLEGIDTARADVRASLRAVILYSYAQKPELVETNRSKTEESIQKALASIAELQPLVETEDGRAALERIAANFKLWDEKFQTIYALSKANNPTEAEAYGTRETRSIAEQLGADVTNMKKLQRQFLERDKADEQSSVRTSKIVNILCFLLSLTAGVVVLRIVMQITAKLSSMVADLSAGSEQITSAASQISSTAQALAQGASEQAASLQETSSSSNEIVSMTKRNAENTKTAMSVMEDVGRQFHDGNERLGDMRSSMNHINGSAEKISKIIKTIDEIAFQTNILALNAAVEAARAGEAGMGFAVVADEVRNLAQRCAQAAKDTASLIEEAIHSSHEGTEKLGKVEEAMAALNAEAEKIGTIVTEVSLSSDEQARGLEQIDKAVTEMEVVTQRAAAGAEESAAAGEELNAQAQTMREVVRQLHALVNSSDEHSASHALDLSIARPAAAKKPAAAAKLKTAAMAAIKSPVHSAAKPDSFMFEPETVTSLNEWK
jgi:methyl-accepting chemotaxis protein/methyl-accepting chemotaxis protein-1 (serine sensor receptor)